MVTVKSLTLGVALSAFSLLTLALPLSSSPNSTALTNETTTLPTHIHFNLTANGTASTNETTTLPTHIHINLTASTSPTAPDEEKQARHFHPTIIPHPPVRPEDKGTGKLLPRKDAVYDNSTAPANYNLAEFDSEIANHNPETSTLSPIHPGTVLPPGENSTALPSPLHTNLTAAEGTTPFVSPDHQGEILPRSGGNRTVVPTIKLDGTVMKITKPKNTKPKPKPKQVLSTDGDCFLPRWLYPCFF